MDPLSRTVSVSSLLVIAARVVNIIHDVRGDDKDAALMLSSITSECTVVHATLARLQSLMLADSQALRSRLTQQVTAVFETALLDEEIKGLVQEENGGNRTPNRRNSSISSKEIDLRNWCSRFEANKLP